MANEENFDLNILAASNVSRFPEGQAPSSLNDGGRDLEGMLARYFEDTDGSVASTGSANAYIMAAKRVIAAYYDGLTITFDANFTNTAAATLDVDSVSADAIVWPDGTTLSGGEIVSGAKITVRHDGTNWQLVAGGTKLLLQTEQATTSGTTVDFTGIGSHAKRITVMLDGVSTDGSSDIIIQLGDSDGFETSDYVGFTVGAAFSTGFVVSGVTTLTDLITGVATLVLGNVANNTWFCGVTTGQTGNTASVAGGGRKSLSAALTQIRLTSASADTFDAGTVNILIE